MALPDKKRNIVLTGFMGTGKSAVGHELQKMTGYKLVDVDREIERIEGRAISEIFESSGEQAFREMETREIRRISEGRNRIISTGGGAVLRDENLEALSEGGAVICLRASADTVYARTKHSRHRPLLKTDDPLEKIKFLMAEREPYYEKAGIMIDTDNKSPYEIAADILEAVGWKR